MKWIGLTGGIASGKSTVAKILRDLGFPVVDADDLARRVVEKGSPTLDRVAEAFGSEVLKADGSLNRQALGKIVFQDETRLLQLESLLHPEIQQLKIAERLRLESTGAEVAFYDVPLLFEKNLQEEFDATMLVYCSAEQQSQRLMERDGLSEEDAKQRLDSQLPLEKKKFMADFIILNTADKVELRSQVKKLLRELDLVSS